MATHIDKINQWEQEHIDALNRDLPFARPMNHAVAIAPSP
jgi:hypothetical protein